MPQANKKVIRKKRCGRENVCMCVRARDEREREKERERVRERTQ